MSIPRLNAHSFVYGIYLAFHVGLIWFPPYFPTQDGPSHIYNLVILRDLINGGAVWGEFYKHQIFVGPSMGFVTATYPLLAVFDPMIAEKLFLSLYVLLTGIAVPALCKAGDKPAFPVSFLALPILFCYPVMMGFYSYILGVPLLLIALTIYWSGRNQAYWKRLIVLNLIGLALFWCHVLAFLLFLMALAAAALSLPSGLGPMLRRSLDVALQSALPLIATALYFIPRWAGGGMEATRSLHPRVLRRSAVNLLGLSMDSFSPTQYRIALFYTGLLAALVAISVYWFWKNRSTDDPASVFERWFLMFAFLTTVFYFITPDQFGVLGLIKLRLPIVIVLSLLPVIRISRNRSTEAAATAAILAIVTICAVTNFIFIRRESQKVDQFMQGLSLPLGEKSVILTYNADCETPQRPNRVDVIKHLASYYGVRKRYLDAGNYEAALGVFNTSFQSSFPRRPDIVEIEERPWTIEWEKYPAIEYVLGWRMTQRDRDRLAGRYQIISEQQELSIWKRTPSI